MGLISDAMKKVAKDDRSARVTMGFGVLLLAMRLCAGCALAKPVDEEAGGESTVPAVGASTHAVIYAGDQRTYAEPGPALDGLAALVAEDRIEVTDGTVRLLSTTVEERLGGPLCSDERWLNEISLAHCSGVLIAADAILTAAHCIPDDEACARTAIVFGFQRQGAGIRSLAPKDVYRCKARSDERTDLDRVRIQLDRFTEREPPRRRSARMGERVTVVGHPAGAPAVQESGVEIVALEQGGFRIYADVEDGSSGSPVFATRADGGLTLVGIVVAGEERDYVWGGECYRTRRLAEREGLGVYAADAGDREEGCAAAGVSSGRAITSCLWVLLMGLTRRRRR